MDLSPVFKHTFALLLTLLLFLRHASSSRVENFIRQYRWNQKLVKGIGDYEVVYPFQIRERSRVGVNTRSYYYTNGTYHYESASFVIRYANGKRLKLHLRKNQELVPPGAQLRDILKDGDVKRITKTPENCYYQGLVHNQPNSAVALSTCTGLKGIIFTEDETLELVPLRGGDLGKRHPHLLYKSTWDSKISCANGHNTEWSSSLERKRAHGRREHRRGKRDAKTTQKYIELGVVADYGLAEQWDFDFHQLLRFTLESVNIVDLVYQRNLNTRVSLVLMEGWSGGNKITITDNIIPTMLNFLDYVSRELYSEKKDMTVFLTSHHFSKKHASLATSGSVCTARASGIASSWNQFQPQETAASMAHTMGHIVGIEHDENKEAPCECKDSRGCIMQKHLGRPEHSLTPEFSECSRRDYLETLNLGSGRCLFNKPLQECARVDRCCDPVTCKLRDFAQCASGPCCDDCKLRSVGLPCRSGTDECDVPEVCDGVNGQCPKDAKKTLGTECGGGKGFCYLGNCATADDQCRGIWGSGGRKAEKDCFETFNPLGSFNGHCGYDGSTYEKCYLRNVECGLLHCQGGAQRPLAEKIGNGATFMKSEVVKDNNKMECKVVTESKFGMAREGSKCGERGICSSGVCVPIEDLAPKLHCPTNNAALPCSGHGVCTNLDWCYCDKGYSGSDCSVRQLNYRPQEDATAPKDQEIPVDEKSLTVASAEKGSLDTVSMLVILGGVVGGVVLILLFLLLCYRRRTTSALRKKKLAARALQEFERYSESSMETNQRSIKFGHMPSYRDEKRKEKRMLHKIHEVSDERDSISNRSKESGERSMVEGMRMANMVANMTSPNESPSHPDRGILKNMKNRSLGVRSVDEELRFAFLGPQKHRQQQGGEDDSPYSAYRVFERSLRKLEEYECNANPYHANLVSGGQMPVLVQQQTSPQSEYWGGAGRHRQGGRPALAVFSPQPTRATVCAPVRTARGGYATDTEIGYTPRSVRRRPSADGDSCTSGNRSSGGSGGSPPHKLPTPSASFPPVESCAGTDRTSPTNSVASSRGLGKAQPLKLRNIEYLLKQLDTPHSASVSPASSTEFSATEADNVVSECIEEGSHTESHSHRPSPLPSSPQGHIPPSPHNNPHSPRFQSFGKHSQSLAIHSPSPTTHSQLS